MRALLAVFLALWASVAAAQPIVQSGTVTPGHVPAWAASGILQDGGTAQDNKLTSLGVTNNGGPAICINSAQPISLNYNQFCWSVSTTTGPTLSYYSFGTATHSDFHIDINGSVYSFPYTVGGIVGPGTTVSGNVVLWNNTAGSLVKDGGYVPMNPADNLSGLANYQTARNNLGLGCPGGNGPNLTTYGSVTGVFVGCFGVLTDGSTDDTAAWNTAVAYANAHVGTTLIAAPGTSKITALNAFTASRSWIKCVAGVGACKISHSTSQALTWTAGGGGMVGMYLTNAGSFCDISVKIRGVSFSSFFEDIVLDQTVGTFLSAGLASPTDSVGLISITGLKSLTGVEATSPCPVIDLINGGGMIISNSVLGASSFTPVFGRNFIDANIIGSGTPGVGRWDSLTVVGNYLGPFANTFHADLTLGGLLLDNTFESNFFINNYFGDFAVLGTGTLSNLFIQNNWMDGNLTANTCISLASTTNIATVYITGNSIIGCNSGIIVASALTLDVKIADNFINGLGNLGGTSYGILVLGAPGAFRGISIQNNSVASDLGVLAFGVSPTYGILVSATSAGGLGVEKMQIIGNNALGVTANYAWPTITTNGIVANNVGLPSATGTVGVGASPITYTAGPQPETVYIQGGTVSDVSQNSVTICTATPCTVGLGAVESAVITYSVAPTITVTKH